MRLPLFFLTGVVLAAAAWAQDPGKPTAATPAEIAAKAMMAMETLDEPAADNSEPNADKTKAATDAKQARTVTTASKDVGGHVDEESAAPSILPAPGAGDGRGMDFMSRSRMDMMIPTGRSHKGVHYPTYLEVEMDRTAADSVPGGAGSVTAPLASLFESDLVTRLDDDHVQFDRAKWVQFDAKPTPDGIAKPTMSLEIERGVYDLKNEILMTNQPVKIENQQFLITGDTMLHDRVSGLTRLTGRVRMTFYNEQPVIATEPVPEPDTAPIPGTSRQP